MNKKILIGSIITLTILAITGYIFTLNNSKNSKVEEKASTVQEVKNANEVLINNFKFSPENIDVKKGTTVTFKNNDSIKHNVSGESDFKSKLLNQGETYTYTFNQTGKFNYKCDPHPYMTGSVNVTE